MKVLESTESKYGCSYWRCQCDCGQQRTIRARHLVSGRAKSCGCWSKDLHREILLNDPISPPLDLVGKRFGRLLVVAREPSKHNRTRWLCVCDCDTQVITSGKNLRDGKKKSCGCLRREMQTISAENTSNGSSQFRRACAQYKANAEKRGLAFSLTQEEFTSIAKKECFYCGKVPSLLAGIDRKDNQIGYCVENSVPCCQVCNYMKRVHSVEDFLKQCQAIVEYQNHKQ